MQNFREVFDRHLFVTNGALKRVKILLDLLKFNRFVFMTEKNSSTEEGEANLPSAIFQNSPFLFVCLFFCKGYPLVFSLLSSFFTGEIFSLLIE